MTQHLPSAPSGRAVLTLGGVDVQIRSEYPLVHYSDPPYLPFLAPSPDPGVQGFAIDVEVLVSRCPANQSPVVFDSDIAWRMQPEDGGYRLSFRRTDSEHVHTVLCSDRATSQVRIYVQQDEPPERPFVEGVTNPVHYPLDQLLFMNHLAMCGGVISHAAAAVVEGGALLLPGISGAGKSTVSQMFIDAGLGDSLLSDDRVILRRGSVGEGRPERLTAWGTPWPGDAQVARNVSAPLAAVLFLVKAEVDEVVPISAGAAMRRLMPVVSCPWYDPERLPSVLETCARVVEGVPCYELRFTRDGRVVPLLLEVCPAHH
jgi:hypothetical protein